MPSPTSVPESVIFGNITWNIKLLTVQLLHARKVNTRARSGYYRLAVLIGSSIIEALVYVLLRQKIGPAGVLSIESQHKDSAEFPASFTPSKEDWVMCKRRQIEVCLSSKTDLIHLNDACLAKGIYGRKLQKRIDRIRAQRNKIHFHGLHQIDRRYTKKEVNNISSVINSLLPLVKSV